MTAKVGGGFVPVPDARSQTESLVPISREEFEIHRAKVREAVIVKLPELNENFRQIAENNKKIEEANKGIALSRAMQAEGRAMQAEGRAMQASASQKLEMAEKGLQKVAKERQDILTDMFYAIFNGKKKLPVENIDALFNAYLADRSLSVEETTSGTSYPKINSMRSVTKYLADHPSVPACDFRAFKTEIHDIPTLTEYLKHSTVKAIALKNGISDNAKASLAEAVAARNGGLKIQYFP